MGSGKFQIPLTIVTAARPALAVAFLAMVVRVMEISTPYALRYANGYRLVNEKVVCYRFHAMKKRSQKIEITRP
jgi:hypothetical protein